MIPSANFDNTNFIDFTASSFAGIGISTRFGSGSNDIITEKIPVPE